jgi:hypothetical protein
MTTIIKNAEATAQTFEDAIVELDQLELALIGGGIGNTILSGPTQS